VNKRRRKHSRINFAEIIEAFGKENHGWTPILYRGINNQSAHTGIQLDVDVLFATCGQQTEKKKNEIPHFIETTKRVEEFKKSPAIAGL